MRNDCAPGQMSKDILSELHSCEIISPDEEKKLFKEYRRIKNIAKREQIRVKIIKSNLRLVYRLACDYSNLTRLPVSDFYSAGKFGLLTAFNKYSPESPVKFASFAIWDIRWEMQQFIASSDAIHIPPKVRQKLMKLRRDGKGKPSDIQFGEEAARALTPMASMEAALPDGTGEPFHSIIPEPSEEPDNPFDDPWASKSLEEAMGIALDEHEKMVMSALYGLKGYEMSTREIGEMIGVSKEHIRTIKNRALAKLRNSSLIQELYEECTGCHDKYLSQPMT